MFTLDTNIVIGYLNDEAEIADQILSWRREPARFCISVITEIEALSFPKLTTSEIAKIQRLLQELTIIPADSQLGRLAAELRRQYQFKLGDSIIVATARLTNSILVTRDKSLLKKAKQIISVKTILKSPA